MNEFDSGKYMLEELGCLEEDPENFEFMSKPVQLIPQQDTPKWYHSRLTSQKAIEASAVS